MWAFHPLGRFTDLVFTSNFQHYWVADFLYLAINAPMQKLLMKSVVIGKQNPIANALR